MRTIMKKSLVIVIAIIIAMLLGACGNSDPLVGRWEMTDMSGWGLGSQGREMRDELVTGRTSLVYRFYQNNTSSVTLTTRAGSEVFWSNWSRSNGIVSIWTENSSDSYFYNILGSELTLTHAGMGERTITLHFTRIGN